jgi:hypothetical protein
MIVGHGTFQGRGGHTLRGRFELLRGADGVRLTIGDDFFFDGSPAPGFALAANSEFTQAQAIATDFHRLPGSGRLMGAQIEVSGRQEALIPARFNLDDFDTLFLWCFMTPFLLGVGPIVRSGD